MREVFLRVKQRLREVSDIIVRGARGVTRRALFLFLGLSLLFLSMSFGNTAFAQPTGTLSVTGQSRSCQARETGIKNRMNSLMSLVTSMENTFDSIASRVEEFYTSKVVPSGKTVSNYSVLVSDIQTKKNIVTTAVNKAQTDVAGFSCASGNPKAQMTMFRTDMQAVKQALKDYRTSIKDLIVAVHSVTGGEK